MIGRYAGAARWPETPTETKARTATPVEKLLRRLSDLTSLVGYQRRAFYEASTGLAHDEPQAIVCREITAHLLTLETIAKQRHADLSV